MLDSLSMAFCNIYFFVCVINNVLQILSRNYIFSKKFNVSVSHRPINRVRNLFFVIETLIQLLHEINRKIESAGEKK